MALRVLDGNQTATTLSSVVTGGEHIVAHSVVSLGANAIANITSAVSGSVVSISNFPSTQTIAGTVTANGYDFNNTSYHPLPLAPFDEASSGGKAVVAKIIDDTGAGINLSAGVPISGTVSVGNSVTIGSLPAISGTVTANLSDFSTVSLLGDSVYSARAVVLAAGDDLDSAVPLQTDGFRNLAVRINAGSVTIGSLPVISGTVTANGGNFLNVDNALITKDSASNIVLFGGLNYSATPTQSSIDAIRTDGSGAVVVYSSQTNWTDTNAGNQARSASQQTPFPVQILGGSVTIGSLPSGALTTRFGSVTTANLSQITTAVTNTSRKYLLAQNISAGTVTIGIGFSPTTTQGIQLTAGGGLTFDAFCPTGAVYWLGAVTGAAFTILEG